MPKIIENLKDRLIAEAKQQLEEHGYAAMTIRSIAKACGVGVGTVYNYFPSKDALIATHLLEDWKVCLSRIEDTSAASGEPRPVALCIHGQLTGFAQRHSRLFHDEAAAASFAGAFGQYHAMLRAQLAKPLRKFCGSEFASEFVAESLLIWTMEGKSFEEIYEILKNLF